MAVVYDWEDPQHDPERAAQGGGPVSAGGESSEDARQERNRLVLEALQAGWTHARIAEATGLTRGRVGQIALTGAVRRVRAV